jgi:hypothetical protein
MVDIGVAISTIRTISNVVQQAGKLELTQQVIDLQQTLLQLVAQNAELTASVARLEGDNRQLRDEAELRRQLAFQRDSYWRLDGDSRDGPFCSRCFDVDRKTVRLHAKYHGYYSCPNCQRSVCVYPEQDGTETSPRTHRMDGA